MQLDVCVLFQCPASMCDNYYQLHHPIDASYGIMTRATSTAVMNDNSSGGGSGGGGGFGAKRMIKCQCASSMIHYLPCRNGHLLVVGVGRGKRSEETSSFLAGIKIIINIII